MIHSPYANKKQHKGTSSKPYKYTFRYELSLRAQVLSLTDVITRGKTKQTLSIYLIYSQFFATKQNLVHSK